MFKTEGRWSKNKLLLAVFCIFISIPILFILSYVFVPGSETWQFILKNLIKFYIRDSFLLMLFTGIGVLIIGVLTAWIVSMYDFIGKKYLSWLLILPLAIPGYIAAYTYSGLFDITGPVYKTLEPVFGSERTLNLLPEMKSLAGAAFILTMVLFPYVYVITRTYFANQFSSYTDVAATLGLSRRESFFRLALPMARPAIVAGLSLVMMELLNDYGTVKYLGIDTFTIGIFTAWSSFGDTGAALKIAAWLLIVVLIILMVERKQRGNARFDTGDKNEYVKANFQLSGLKSFIAFIICFLPVLFGFIIPLLLLIYWALLTFSDVLNLMFFSLLINSFLLALSAAVLCVIVSMSLAYALRVENTYLQKILIKITTVGYAIPGAVIAVGIMVPVILLDKWLIGFLQSLSVPVHSLILTGSIGILLYGYVVRFLAVSFNSIDSGYQKIPKSLSETSRSLGFSTAQTFLKIDLPLLKKSLFAGAILVFVDVIKELPLTLILRPFNFDTLAIKAFELASDEMVAQSAPAALVIIACGVVPVLLLNRIFIRVK